MLKQPVPTRTRRFLAHTVLGSIVLAGSLSVYAAQPTPAAQHHAVADTDHFTVKIDVATRGHAPSMHFTQCLAKGKPFDLSGSDGPGFSWHGHFVVTPAADGQIQVAGFPNPAGLQATGDNYLIETTASGAANLGAPGEAGRGRIRQGALEASNVNVVEELVDMIETQRAYEVNSKMISATDEMLKYVNQNI